MKDEDLRLRRLKNDESDYKKLYEWYQEEDVYLQFEQRKLNYEEIKNKYLPRTLKEASVPVFIIEFNDKSIGIIQYQKINKEYQKIYGIESNNAYEIDIFIGKLSQHNKGIGRRSINLLAEYLYKEKSAVTLVMCPLENNYSAIKCYEHCGFEVIRKSKLENTIGVLQEYLLMQKI